MNLADRLALRPEFGTRSLKTTALDEVLLSIQRAFPGTQERPIEDIDAIIKRITHAVSQSDWQNVTVGDVGIALSAYLEEIGTLSPAVRDFLEAEARVTTRPQLLEVIVQAYLTTWVASSKKTQYLSNLIMEKAQQLPRRWKSVFSSCPYFLDWQSGPQDLASKMVAITDPYIWLKGIGLPAPYGKGFMRVAHSAFLAQTPEPRSSDLVDKLVSWVTPKDATPLNDTRAAEVVDKLLSPWIFSECPADLREHCTGQILGRFGDPRNENPGFWHQVGRDQKRVILKWLARKSMEAMFEVVTEAEKHAGDSLQWEKRKRFWMGEYDKGHIDEAWIALGSRVIPVARQLFNRSGDKAFLSFGEQVPRPDTCLLFMKIGDKVVVEGSHSFRVHIFPTSARETPILYADKYDLAEILLPEKHPDARMHDTGGNWMQWVRRRIR